MPLYEFYYFSMILTFGTNQMILLTSTAKAINALFCPSTGAQVGNDEESLQRKGRVLRTAAARAGSLAAAPPSDG